MSQGGGVGRQTWMHASPNMPMQALPAEHSPMDPARHIWWQRKPSVIEKLKHVRPASQSASRMQVAPSAAVPDAAHMVPVADGRHAMPEPHEAASNGSHAPAAMHGPASTPTSTFASTFASTAPPPS